MYKKAKITLPENAWPHPDELPKYHAEEITQYCDEVLLPALMPLERLLTDAYYGNLPDPLPTNEELTNKYFLQLETAKGLFLALGAVWERQLRNYLYSFAKKLGDIKVEKIAHGNNRAKVLEKIEEYTGTPVEPEGTRLAEFSLVANVCRHGMGPSLRNLYETYRDHWWYSNVEYTEDSPMLWNMQIRAADLRDFASQIRRYWESD